MISGGQPTFGFPSNTGSNPAFRAASWGNAANFRRGQTQRAQGLAAKQQGAQSRYNIANRQYQYNMSRDTQNERDQFLRFGVNALSGLMR